MADDALYQFLGGYFHQDWDTDAKNWEEVVSNYLADEPSREDLEQLSLRLHALLARHPVDDAALEHELFKDLACEYYPPGGGDGISTRQ